MNHLLKISDAASLALHTMSLLARHPKKRFSNSQIADLLDASEHSLAKVMQRLARARLVDSQRGPSGGFTLARDAESVTVLEIYEAVDGSIGEACCLLGNGPCVTDTCLLGGLVARVHGLIRDEFSNNNLAQLAVSMKLGDRQYGQPQHN